LSTKKAELNSDPSQRRNHMLVVAKTVLLDYPVS
jgi:hypothetical protein